MTPIIKFRHFPLVAALLLAAALLVTARAARAQADPPVSFAGKQIRLFVGFSPTGFGYDTYGRLLARHLGQYLPGRPSVVVLNKPGAGSLNLANYIYNVAPRDGSEIAIVGRGVAADPMLNGNASNAMFDATRFTWLGSMNNEVSGFYVRQPGPAANLADILAGTNLKVGATGAGGDQQVFAAALNALLRTRLTTIGGYPGTNEILLAVERGELDGIVGYSWGVARSGNKDLLESGKLKIVMQLALGKHKELPTVPLVTDFVTDPGDKKVLEVIFSRQSMGRPLVAPPDLDPRLTQALRAGFAAAMNDPELLAESARSGLEINFVGGEDVQALVEGLYRSPPAVVARAQAIAAAK
ncbi:MAG TPA: tripartite tricarboxylate transporter substrate-binding protein [Xanthobacteraceae bacterium]|jgi:tripartite-type tricarboxylate transporter receptor subunit TctC